ncbi:unnamed protein product [Pedinophyceae sp. YPF-701]|nr:unnamed protein product [Pedinophyceae sp. YPF-701]
MLAGVKFVAGGGDSSGESDKGRKRRHKDEQKKHRHGKERKEKKASKKERKKDKHERKGGRRSTSSSPDRSRSPPRSLEPHPAQAQPRTDDAAVATKQADAPGGRSDWMVEEAGISAMFEDPRLKREREAEEKRQQDQHATRVKMSARELNPEMRIGAEKGQAAAAPHVATKAGVGDMGKSWRIKALRRAREQSKETGVPVEELVKDRWGSLAELMAGITEDDIRAASGHAHSAAARARREGREVTVAVREGGAADRKGGWRERARERRRDREGGAASERSSDDRRDRGGRNDQRDDRREREREGGDRRRDRRREEGSEGPQRGGSDRERPRGRQGYLMDVRASGENDPARRKMVRPGGRGGVSSDVLETAPGMNKFANDGSFWDKFSGGVSKEALEEAERDATRRETTVRERSTVADEEAALWEQREQEETGDGGGGGSGDERGGGAAAPASANMGAAAALRARLGGGAATKGDERQRSPDAGAAAPQGGNLGAAAALRARLMGRAPPASDGARPAEAHGAGRKRERHEEVLPLIDAKGMPVAGAFGREAASRGAQEKRVRAGRAGVQRYNAETGERERYFKDDDEGGNIAEMAARERLGGRDMDRDFAMNVARTKRFRVDKEMDADAEYDFDQGIEMFERRRGKETKDQAEARDRQRQIGEHRRVTGIQSKCLYCVENGARPRHLVVAVATTTYLMLPPTGRLADRHCQIVVAEHTPSVRQALDDETTALEIRNFKKCLIRMAAEHNEGVVFMETAMGLGTFRGHARIDAVPVPRDVLDEAPMWFKKAIDESESEWSTHHGKRLLKLTPSRPLQSSVPPSFPYLAVDFGLDDGYAHVIDDEAKFPANLGRDTLISMLGLPPEDMHRRGRTEARGAQDKVLGAFRAAWNPHDWTKQLD